MNVLFLTFAYPPQKFPRSVQISHLVQYLRQSINLKVITYRSEDIGDKSLLEFTPQDNLEYADRSRLTRFVEKSKGHRIKEKLLPDFQYLWHFDLYNSAVKALKGNKFDVVVTFGQPMSSHITGLKLKKKFPHIKWVAHFSDPWVDNIYNTYNSWTRFINQYYQDRVFNAADKMIFTSLETVNLVSRNYSESIKKKCLTLPHSFNESLYASSTSSTGDKKFIIRYLGNFYGKRQPDFLFEALKRIPNLNRIQVELIGSATTAVEENILKNNLEGIVVAKKPVSYIESLKLMKDSDLLINIDAPGKLSPFLPSKLIDYIGSNKPIFAISPDGTSKRILEEMGFMVAHPNNVQDISEKLLKTIESVLDKKLVNVPQDLREEYSIQIVGEKFKTILST